MDSLTQFTLGATVGVAVLGRRLGLRKAAVTGGLLGTLPDLDVLLPVSDPVEAFVGHRGASHSLLVHAALTPFLGEGLRRLFAGLRDNRGLAYMAVFLCLTTHALLDAMTVYGTRLFWPLWREPLGLGSIFIIDPLYTLPLLALTLWALVQKSWTPVFGRGLAAALVLSTGYLAWSAVAQHWVERRGGVLLAEQGIVYERLMAAPTPFNTLFWRVIAVNGARYYNAYLPLLGGDAAATLYRHERWPTDLACGGENGLSGNRLAATLAAFTDGFYAVGSEQGAVVFSDLRMGLAFNYVFRFVIAEHAGQATREVAPRRLRGERRSPGDFDWLTAGIAGHKALRPAEENHAMAPARGNTAGLASDAESTC